MQPMAAHYFTVGGAVVVFDYEMEEGVPTFHSAYVVDDSSNRVGGNLLPLLGGVIVPQGNCPLLSLVAGEISATYH